MNAAITLERPLLIKGEPGTGKTLLAEEVARSLGMPLYQWHIKSTTKAQQGLYEYDAVSRLRDSQLGDARVGDIANYIVKGVLWRAFESPEQAVVLVDEIDKATSSSNDLLRELDRMGSMSTRPSRNPSVHPPHHLHHVKKREGAAGRLLRRCFFHYIRFPKRNEQAIAMSIARREEAPGAAALEAFFEIREMRG